VNGKQIHGETLLHHGDRIALGMNHFFRLNCPVNEREQLANNSSSLLQIKNNKSFDDFNRAQEEILLQSRSLMGSDLANGTHQQTNDPNSSQEDTEVVDETEEKSVSSSTTFSNSNSIDENGLSLEMAIQKFEQDYANLKSDRLANLDVTSSLMLSTTCSSNSSSANGSKISTPNTNIKPANKSFVNDLQFRKGLQKLREKLLRANSLAREANSLCKEMNKPLKFRVTLQIPAANLTPNRRVCICSHTFKVLFDIRFNQTKSNTQKKFPSVLS
jgi:kinesin family protein 13